MNISLNSSDHLNYSSSPQKFRTSTPNLTYKPRVNFHSIESLATPFSSPHQNQNDTGYNSSTPTFRDGKKSRRKLSDWQIWYLNEVYAQNRYPTSDEQEQIASQLHLPISTIRIWFQNHRARHGKR